MTSTFIADAGALARSYQIGERATGLLGLTMGGTVLILGLVLWWFSDAGSLAKGLGVGLTAFGLVFGATSGAYAAMVQRRLLSGLDAPQAEVTVTTEVMRVAGVLAHGYTVPLVIFTGLVVLGLGLALVSSDQP